MAPDVSAGSSAEALAKAETSAKAEPKIIWTFPAIRFCAGCNRPAPINHEGREYLFSYDGGPGVCSETCAPRALAKATTAPDRPVSRPVRRSVGEGGRPSADILLQRARIAGPKAIARHMAEFIVQRAAGQQSCTHDQLIDAGFSIEEIARHRKAAVGLAAGIAPDLRGEGAAA